MPFSHELAEQIDRVGRDGVPRAALDWARTALTDTVGVMLGGVNEPATRIVTRTLGLAAGPGTSPLFGTSLRTSMLDATFINGTAAHALDFDDGCTTMGGHPSAPLTPPLLALAAEYGASGKDLLDAFIAGFETEIRFGRGVHFHHYEKGWHPTATLGTFGAVAACSRLLGLSVAQTAMALAIATSAAAGIKANFGTMTKPLHVGQCARNGLLAALLARDGFTANLEAFEQKQGFFNVYNGPGTFDFGRILESWSDPLELQNPTVGLKLYPCCGSTHPAIDVTLDLTREHDLKPESVEKVDVSIHPRKLLHLNKPRPTTGLEGKYSIQYAVARALADRCVQIEHFEGGAPMEARIAPLLSATHAHAAEDLPDGVEVTVTLRDGTCHSRREEDALHFRRGPSGRPVETEELWNKFRTCAERALPEGQVKALFAELEKLPERESVSEFIDLLVLRN